MFNTEINLNTLGKRLDNNPLKDNIENKKKTKVFIVNGMRRSGLHCIVNDIIYHYNYNNNIKLQYRNDVSLDDYNRFPKNNTVFMFEDQLNILQSKMDTQFNIIIIRDIYNNLTSRIKKSNIFKAYAEEAALVAKKKKEEAEEAALVAKKKKEEAEETKKVAFKKRYNWAKVDEYYLETMKKILREILGITNNIPDKIIINYDLYISSNDYRSSILKQFDILNITPFSKEIPHYGGGKTFKKHEKRESVIIDNYTYSLIKNDLEFIELVREYYNYDLIQKLDKHVR